MNTTNTNTLRTYLQVQAIEPTDNMQYLAKKSGKYTTMFLVTLIIGVLVSLTITPLIGVPLVFIAFIFGFMSAKITPQAQFLPKEEHNYNNDPDNNGPLGWSVGSPFHSSRH